MTNEEMFTELETVGKKYGYQLGMLSSNGKDTIEAIFHKEEQENEQMR